MTTKNSVFSCLCFGPGLPPQGRHTQGETTSEHLLLTIDGRLIRLPWTSCAVSGGGSELQKLFLKWESDNSRWTIIPNDEAALAQLIAGAPKLLTKGIERWQQGIVPADARARRRAALIATTVVVAIILVLLYLSS